MSPEGVFGGRGGVGAGGIGVARSVEAPLQGAARTDAFPWALPRATVRSARWAWRRAAREQRLRRDRLRRPLQGAVRADAFPWALPRATVRSARWAWRRAAWEQRLRRALGSRALLGWARGRWPVARGRWPVASGQWPVDGGRWPVARGRGTGDGGRGDGGRGTGDGGRGTGGAGGKTPTRARLARATGVAGGAVPWSDGSFSVPLGILRLLRPRRISDAAAGSGPGCGRWRRAGPRPPGASAPPGPGGRRRR